MKTLVSNQHIIAIGASAGGMEAIQSFFDHTPLDGVSYVIIQHLSPDYKSRMAELLKRHSKLEICVAENNMTVKVNKVYLIPNTKFMSIKNGKLKLVEKTGKHSPHMTIDVFFSSLAAERGERAIGIILSGTGKDGAEGIKAIQESGGMVIVQDPATAKFEGMPTEAINTGLADKVLAPELMPGAIEDYVNKADLNEVPHDVKQGEGDENTLLDILNLIKSRLPLDFSEYKRPTIVRRIKRRMGLNNFLDTDKYLAFLEDNPSELALLTNDFLISVTSFFRDPDAWAALEKEIIPEIVKANESGDPLKIWVTGCATGEEAYSMAILVKEYLTKMKLSLEVRIFATDINKVTLDIASKGIYPDKIQREVSKERLDLFFTKAGHTYKINKEIRKMVIFAQHDLVKNPPYCNIDLISCRNLLIYMNLILQKKVLSSLHFGVKRGGYLFLGSSENVSSLKGYFSEINKKWRFFKNMKPQNSPTFDNFSASAFPTIIPRTELLLKPDQVSFQKVNFFPDVNEVILSESGFAGVCIDEGLKVIGAFGDLGKYLHPKTFNFELNELSNGALSIALRTAVHKALKFDKRFVLKHVKIEDKEMTRYVDLIVKPFLVHKTSQKLIIVLFKEDGNDHIPDDGELFKNTNIKEYIKEYIKTLEEELKNTKGSLDLVNEKIESSNENMQSFTEELQSANEEMQSANEEMQSINEELETVNVDHQLKIRELIDLNDDLNNYFRSNLNGQLFVDNDLRLKKFSPAAAQYINIRESDIGRPIGDITTNIQFETLIEDIKKVVLTGKVIIKEVQSSLGRWYQVRSMPYIRESDGKAEGVIITFNDITHLIRTQKELDHSNKSLSRINSDLENFVYAAAHDLTSPLANIEGLINLIKDEKDLDKPEISQIINRIDTAIVKFKQVIKDLTEIGRLETDLEIDRDTIDFSELTEDIRFSILNRVDNSNEVFFYDFRVKEIKFSKKNLRSILYNLITNAIKYKSSNHAPKIIIRTEAVPHYIMLSVQDNGIGIKADQINKIFDKYEQLNPDLEGNGLGLFLTKKIINAAGGKIEVESEIGKGSTFKIFFKNNTNGEDKPRESNK